MLYMQVISALLLVRNVQMTRLGLSEKEEASYTRIASRCPCLAEILDARTQVTPHHGCGAVNPNPTAL